MKTRFESANPTSPLQSQPFGLVAWLEQTRVRLPLKGVECRFHVCGELLNVELDQVFHQDSTQPLDCIYTFPLPAGAAVYRCEMHINGRCIRARVEEQGRAREIIREQHAAGRRTALVEVERDNLFTLSLGNVQPGDLVIIQFAYFQCVTRLGDWTSLRVPFCPGVRYIPGQPLLRSLRGPGIHDDTDQVPDASRISPPRMEALHPDAAYLVVQGQVDNAAGTLKDISSPSHPLLVREGESRLGVALADAAAVPDCDLVVRWTESLGGDVQATGWVNNEDGAAFALIRLRAPRLETAMDEDGQDFYFVVDRSGSMTGLKWEKAMEAFRSFIGLLGSRDRAWLTLFSNTHTDFAERPFTAEEWKAESAMGRLEHLGANGGTELLPALKHVLEVMKKHSPDRHVAMVLITDGEVGNEAAILDALRPYPDVCIHTFGIDTTVNDALLARMAEQQRGTSCLLTPADDIAGAVTRIGTRLRPPVLTAISVQGNWELPGNPPTGVHSEEVVMLCLKGQAGATELTLHARGADGMDRTFRVPLTPQPEPALRLLWARRHIDHCIRTGSKSKAIALATHYNVLCEGAAFVAWDEAEQTTVAIREVYQPSMQPSLSLVRSRTSLRSNRIGFVEEPGQDEMRSVSPAAERPVGGASFAVNDTSPPGLLKRILRQVQAPQRQAEEKLRPLLANLSPSTQQLIQKQGLARASWWYARMIETEALGDQPIDRLLELLFRWAAEVTAEFEQRMLKLEALLERLELVDEGSGKGLSEARAWAQSELAASPASLRQVLGMLDQAALQPGKENRP